MSQRQLTTQRTTAWFTPPWLTRQLTSVTSTLSTSHQHRTTTTTTSSHNVHNCNGRQALTSTIFPTRILSFSKDQRTKNTVGNSINFTSVLGDLLLSRLTFGKSVSVTFDKLDAASASVLGDLDNNFGCSKAGLLSVYSNSVGTYIDEPLYFRRWRPSFPKFHRIFSSLLFGLTCIFLSFLMFSNSTHVVAVIYNSPQI